MNASATSIPRLVAKRRWWLVPLALWALVVTASLSDHLDELREQGTSVAVEGARHMFRMIVLTRAWNSAHGGVYVPVGDKAQPNPYLDDPQRDIVTTDGRRLTLINPAYMTRLMAELARQGDDAVFHITSLNPIRPANAPDDWERRALGEFESGKRETIGIVDENGSRRLRYMAPLMVDAPCLKCHARQGYRIGDVRGGISVSLPFGQVEQAIAHASRQTVYKHVAAFLLVAAIGALLFELLRRRWLGLGETIGELKTARQALESSNRELLAARDAARAADVAKAAFLTNMSHELRTPLNVISGYSHLLAHHIEQPEQRKQLQGIQDATDKLLELISLLLDLTRAESGQLKLQEEDFDLLMLLGRLDDRLRQACRAKGLASRIDSDGVRQPCWLRGDSRRIAQLLGQYIDNAVKFSNHGEIVLRAVTEDLPGQCRRVEFSVIDQGIGIAPDVRERLFSLCQQADASATRRHGGNGVGLYICRQLAALMGGTVGVDSEPGKGSRFWFAVTLEQRRPAPAPSGPLGTGSPAASGDERLAQLRQLLADDDFRVNAWWREHQAELVRRLGPQADTIGQCIGEFRFDAALKLLPPADDA